MLRLSQPPDSDLRALLDRSRPAQLTYEEAAATRSGRLPAGYRLDHYDRQLGSGPRLFERAFEALRNWQAHVGAGVRVFPDGATVETDSTVLFVLRAIGVWAIAPCRVVYVVTEPSRFGFAYGTLPGHPEQGEVAMTIGRDDADSVVARIESFSRTVDPLARAAFPLARAVQKRVTNCYLEALAAAAVDSL